MACSLSIPSRSGFSCGKQRKRIKSFIIPAGAKIEGDCFVWQFPRGEKYSIQFSGIDEETKAEIQQRLLSEAVEIVYK